MSSGSGRSRGGQHGSPPAPQRQRPATGRCPRPHQPPANHAFDSGVRARGAAKGAKRQPSRGSRSVEPSPPGRKAPARLGQWKRRKGGTSLLTGWLGIPPPEFRRWDYSVWPQGEVLHVWNGGRLRPGRRRSRAARGAGRSTLCWECSLSGYTTGRSTCFHFLRQFRFRCPGWSAMM